MKKIITITAMVFLALIANVTFSQSTFMTNVRPLPVAFLGWDGTGANSGTLDVRNDFTVPQSFPINFWTNLSQRMTIFDGTYNNTSTLTVTPNVARVGISYLNGNILTPSTMLHMGMGANTSYRKWMDIGTYYDAGDCMYVGLKEEAPGTGNRLDAAIAWGNDTKTVPPAAGPDFLRFIFLNQKLAANALGGGFDGLEVTRISPYGHFGIGNFFNDPNYPVQLPARRLEVLDDQTTEQGVPPCVRYTFQQPNGNAQMGIYTDFSETPVLGNYIIQPLDLNQLANTGTQNLQQRFTGFHTTTPQNTVEINSQYNTATTPNGQPAAPGFGPPSGWAGLRFTKLTAGNSIPELNPGPGVLSVNRFGDVIYVPYGGGGLFGGICGAPGLVGLPPGGWEIPLNGQNYIFSGNSLNGSGDRVGIGTMPSPCTPQAKLEVQNDGSPGGAIFAGLFQTSGTNTSAGGSYWGTRAQAFVTGATWNNIGGDFAAWNSLTNNIGVAGVSDGAIGQNNFGGYFEAQASANNFGMYALVDVPPTSPYYPSGGVNIAVYGHADYVPYNPSISYPLATHHWAGYFDGNINVNGFGYYAGAAWITSDQQFKTEIDSITNALSIIKQLKPRTYYMDTTNVYGLNFSNQHQLGFIAQDVQSVLPQLVAQAYKSADVDSSGNTVHQSVSFKTLNYTGFIPLLCRGIQEQSRTIDSLKTKTTKQDSINAYLQNEINTLTSAINACCNANNNNHAPIQNNNGGNNGNDNKSNSNNTSNIDVTLQDGQTVVLSSLFQNQPNPFSEMTVINYFLTQDVQKAEMLFYNSDGKLIQSVELNQRGSGSITVYAADLSKGLYSYTMVIDSKIFATKKMVKQ